MPLDIEQQYYLAFFGISSRRIVPTSCVKVFVFVIRLTKNIRSFNVVPGQLRTCGRQKTFYMKQFLKSGEMSDGVQPKIIMLGEI